MNNWWSRTLILIVALVSYAAYLGCSSSDIPAGDTRPPQLPGGADTGAIGSATLRDTSGLPSGVRLTWTSSTDTTVAAYHVYKSGFPIPDDARGNPALWLSINSSPNIPQPTNPGDAITVDDIFPVAVGEVYYYRLAAVGTDDSESLLSPEISVTISTFSVTGLSDSSVGVGAEFSVLGQGFGLYDGTTDEVTVLGNNWVPGTGFVSSALPCTVVDWQPSAIAVTLPNGATSSRVSVTIDGVTQTTTQNIINADPFIVHCSQLSADPGDMITLAGQNFGGPVNNNHRVVFGSLEMTSPGDYLVYAGDMITFECPSLPSGNYDVRVAVDDVESNSAQISIGTIIGPSWEHTWGSSSLDSAAAVTTDDANGVYLAGFSASYTADPMDALIVKYDAGLFAWGRVWNNIDNDPAFREETLNDICHDPAGNLYATGGAISATGSPCLLLLAYDAKGNWLYTRSFVGDAAQPVSGNHIACDGSYLYIAGTATVADANLLLVKYDLAGNFIQAQEWPLTTTNETPYDIAIDGNGDLITVGNTEDSFGASGTDWFILKTDADLIRSWAAYWGSLSEDNCRTVAVDATSNVLVGGASRQWTLVNLEPVLVVLDSAGLVTAENRWPVAGNSAFVSLDFASGGHLYAVGSRGAGVPDAMVYILDPPSFDVLGSWSYTGAAGRPVVLGGCIDANDDVLLCGTAPRLGAAWNPLVVTTAPIIADSDYLAVSTDLTTSAGTSVSLSGESLPVTGTEDTGAGNSDLLAVKYNPE